MCPTKKTPITDIIQPVLYWVHDRVTHNITILLLEMEMYKPEYFGFFLPDIKFVFSFMIALNASFP